jgi:hypothetical protein
MAFQVREAYSNMEHFRLLEDTRSTISGTPDPIVLRYYLCEAVTGYIDEVPQAFVTRSSNLQGEGSTEMSTLGCFF